MPNKLTYSFVKDYIDSTGNIMLDNDYINAHKHLTIKCGLCEYVYQVTWNNFQRGRRCPKCARTLVGRKNALSHQSVITSLEAKGYIFLGGEYKCNTSRLVVKCPNEHTFESTWAVLQREGCPCPKCGNKMIGDKLRKPISEVKQFISDNSYELLNPDEYTNSNRYNLILLCPNGHEWKVSFSAFNMGNRCPFCAMSSGEQIIANWLVANNYCFQYNYTVSEVTTNPFSHPKFDFKIMQGDKFCFVEYDGKQHFEPIEYFGGVEGFNNLVRVDRGKDKYCQQHSIPLLRISYSNHNKIVSLMEKFIDEIWGCEKCPIWC
jgi:ribosomal protein S27E